MPPKHKESNTIKFLPFVDRLANVNVDVIHRIGHRNEEENEEEVDSFFFKALQKWNDLNCSQHWNEFRHDVGKIQTLAQLMLVRERIVQSLLKHLEMKDPLTQQAILEMVVALARDLRQEFYPYYPDFLSRIVVLLNTKEAETLEWAFQCLAYLFKFLWRCMVRTVAPVLSSLLPLLSPKRPKYIHYFAADSFAFLARKVKDQTGFVKLLVKHLEEHPEDAEGCGRLVFAWLRGIKGQLHSCSQNVLLLLMCSLGDESLHTDLLAELLSHTVTHLATEIRPGALGFFWDACQVAITSFISALQSGKTEATNAIGRILPLVRQLCDHCEAAHLTAPVPLVQQLVSLLGLSPPLPENVLIEAAHISATLLLSTSVCLKQEHAVKLTAKVLALPHPGVLLKFVEDLLSWGSLETLVLPRLLELITSSFILNGAKGIELQLLARLVQYKAGSLQSSNDIRMVNSYPLDFSASCKIYKPEDVMRAVLFAIELPKEATSQVLLDFLEQRLCALLVVPHVRPIDVSKVQPVLKHLLAFLCTALQEVYKQREMGDSEMDVDTSDSDGNGPKLLLLLFASLEAAIRTFGKNKIIEEILPPDVILKTLLPYARCGSGCLGALRILDVYLSAVNIEKGPGKEKLVSLIYSSLECNLSAPHHLVREVTCRIFSLLPLEDEVLSIFTVCLHAETTSATITDYRDKLQLLQKLSYESTRAVLLKHSMYKTAPMRFILGSLYVNFQLLWEPVQSLVASYASGMPLEEFWPVFHEHLCLATSHRDMPPDQGSVPHPSFEWTLVTDCFSQLFDVDDRPDHANYRLLLWQATHKFSDVCEVRNRDTAALFLTFIEEEYLRSNAEVANTWNIKKHDTVDTRSENDDEDEEKYGNDHECDKEKESDDSDDDDNDDSSLNPKLTKPKSSQRRRSRTKVDLEEHTSGRLMSKTLLSVLGLFAKFRNPRVVYREPELNQIYHDLLSHKNPDVQKLALDCILTYKHKYLTPYSQHLYSLIDNKSFKSEMTSFSIDKDSSTIQEEHRPQLIPVIMRIVYSKMVAKTGLRTGGKAGGAMRRSLVLRFLAGCHEDEMLVFIRMAFRFYNHLLQEDPSAMVKSIQSSMELDRVVPPRRLQSALNLLSVVQEQFGGLMGNKLLALILRLLVCVGATVDGILQQRDSVHAGYLNALRLLRTSCLEVLTQFFDRFEAYPWSGVEIDTVLQVFVWPVICRLPVEGVHSPTALLKLLMVWSQHPRYFALFGAYSCGEKHVTPLPVVMSLLLGEKTHSSVSTAVMELIENLLTLRDHGDDDPAAMEIDETMLEERAPSIPVTNFLTPDEDSISQLQLPYKLNLGSKLLFPHIPSLLERIRIRLAATSKRGHGLNKRELVILSAVSEMVRAPDTSATLAQLLVPLLTRRSSAPHEDDEPVLKMLNTLSHLVKNVVDPHAYIRPLAGLFSCIDGVAGRKMLVSLIGVVAEATAKTSLDMKDIMEVTANLVRRLNAYDKRWVEQPDFDTRLDAFKEVQSLLDAGKLTVDLGAIIVHHCFYIIRAEKDMSLRDFAGHCLRRVAPVLSLQLRDDVALRDFFIDSTVLSLIRSSINKASSETLHAESVQLLGQMAVECWELHPVLRDLNLLTNKVDLEVDFFQNLQHLQLHRKTRALLKFCEVYRGLEKAPTPRTLTQFILPLASQFLCSEKYVGKNSLVDAAISAIGVVCRLLPWHQYEAILRFYLLRLRSQALYQKQLVRIVVVILDGFHFDLSRAHSVSTNKTRDSKNGGTQKAASDIPETEHIDSAQKTEVSVDRDDDKIKEAEDLQEHLESVASKEGKAEEMDMEVEEVTEETKTLAMEKQVVLCPSAALRIIRTITLGLLPQLNRALTARTVMESTHRVNKKQVQNNYRDFDAEEEEMLRVPIALAVVKLLQRLPEIMLVQNLPGVLVKLCTYLKSRLESVRRVTRETLQKIMISLGPTYLSTLLREMTSLLTRGFEVHVLVFSIHSVIFSLKEKFLFGSIDSSVQYIIEVCKMDLFGQAAEDKEEGKVAVKLHEARSTKSYDTLNLTAQFVSESCLTDLLLPFKDIIQTAHSHKIINRASDCLRHIVLGLSENTMVPPNSLLLFAFGVASESIPALALKGKRELSEKQKEIEARKRSDCYIIKEAPKHRVGITSTDAARVAARMNAHVFVEFGLRLIYSLLKHEKLKTSEEDCRPLLDSLVSLLADCLHSQHVKLSTLALQCLTWLFRMDLPSLHKHIRAITSSVFTLLHKFAAAGLSKGDNFDLVVASFKAVAVLVRDVKHHTLEQDQLKALLLYAEQDLADVNRHATAFSLLKAILSRKFIIPEIHDVMDKVATLSITAELPHVRLQARLVFHQFLMDYPLGKKLEKHLSFYLSQLNYELQPGRESALEMVHSVIVSFPSKILSQQSGLFFLMLGARLVNDDSPDCRRMVAQCIGKMLGRLTKNERDRLFSICVVWLRDKKVSHRRLAAQLCGLFVLTEKDSFNSRLCELLPVIVAQFSSVLSDDLCEPGRFVKAPSACEEETTPKPESERMRDHHLYQIFQLILKICTYCPDWLTTPDFYDHVFNLTEHAQTNLAHPHEWVRLSAAQFLTHALGVLSVSSLSEAARGQDHSSIDGVKLGYFKIGTQTKLKSMILDHCAQLAPGNDVGQPLLFQVVKNLVIFADILKDVCANPTENGQDASSGKLDEASEKSTKISLGWLVRRMRRIVHTEVAVAPKSTTMRTMVLNWTAAIVVKLGPSHIRPVLHHLLAPVVRELTSDETVPEESPLAQLRTLAKEVGSIIKKSVGSEDFMQAQSRLQAQLATVRAERKRQRKQEAVYAPEKAAKRKIQKQVRKKEAKKQRMMKMSGKKKFKKRKEVDLEGD